MAVQKHVAPRLFFLTVYLVCPALIAGNVNQTGSQSPEANGRALGTPTDDGRPGEYYFELGAQSARKGDYTHAIGMYEVAASWAYKPAQYNLGVMYLNGQGTPVDLPRAMAWMALAAERNDAQYVRAKELVYAHLTPEQFAQANVIWRELLPTYGDAVALARAKSRWRETLQGATGSRVGSSAEHLMVSNSSSSSGHMDSPYYDVHDGGHISQNPAEVAGVQMVDGTFAYQQLRATTNPYDPKVMSVSGETTIGPLTPVEGKASDATRDDQPASTGDSSPPQH